MRRHFTRAEPLTPLTHDDTFHLAREAVRAAPSDIAGLVRFCFAHQEAHRAEVIDFLRATIAEMGPDDPWLAHWWGMLAASREGQERLQHGRSPSNAVDAADMHFPFAQAEMHAQQAAIRRYLARKPNSAGAQQMLAESYAASGALMEAEQVIDALRRQVARDTTTASRFAGAFHDTLCGIAEDAVTRLFAPARWLREPAAATPATRVIFIACDQAYMEAYGWTLLDSIARNAGAIDLVVCHVMDLTEAEGAATLARAATYANLSIAIATEWSGLRAETKTQAARNYYHSVRFLRLWDFLRRYPRCQTIQLDVDVTVNGPLDPLFKILDDADVALALVPCRLETRNRILANVVGIGASAAGRNYLQRVAGYIANSFTAAENVWGIDQVALYAVMMDRVAQPEPLRVAAIPPEVSDGTRGSDRAIWQAKG